MPKKSLISPKLLSKYLPMLLMAAVFLLPDMGYATQLHHNSEGIIIHQMGHLFFLFSMVALIITITGKGLHTEKGWRLIQYSALVFILWNLDVIAAHFLDNQIYAVGIEIVSFGKMKIVSATDSVALSLFYYFLKLDHLLCVPAMVFFYKGLSTLVSEQRRRGGEESL
ncbi:MAG: hypothetical protein R6V54_02540 [Desulfobacteraceae bacterium]